MIHARKTFQFSSLLLAVAILLTFLTVPVGPYRQPSASANTIPPYPHVRGTRILDSSGHAFVLRGAQIDGPFANYNAWFNNNNVTKQFNPTVFKVMSQDWHMNALRIPLSNWIYDADPVNYLGLLDQVVQEANQAGIYAILNLHDDDQAGSPYGSGANTPKPESVVFWTLFAAHYANNPMVMFDAFNEPAYIDGPSWVNGGGTMIGSTGKTAPILGMQTLINTIRAAGAKQIIFIGGLAFPVTYAAETGIQLSIKGHNIVYTKHVYNAVASGNPTLWDAQLGYFKDLYPIYYGEWALLPNPNASQPERCLGATMQNANQLVTNFLNYMDQYHMSWTAWAFDTDHLILDYTNFTPTRLDDPNNPWVCPTPTAHAGMGTVVQNFLLTH